jgi:hypothetical protein
MTKKSRIILMTALSAWAAFTLWVLAKGYLPF